MLKVKKGYGGGKTSTESMADWDVFITTPASAVPSCITNGGVAQRLILDESHLYEQHSGSSMKTAANNVLPQTFGHGSSGHTCLPHPKPRPHPGRLSIHDDQVLRWNTLNVWCVTGTPFSHSFSQLQRQSQFLG